MKILVYSLLICLAVILGGCKTEIDDKIEIRDSIYLQTEDIKKPEIDEFKVEKIDEYTYICNFTTMRVRKSQYIANIVSYTKGKELYIKFQTKGDCEWTDPYDRYVRVFFKIRLYPFKGHINVSVDQYNLNLQPDSYYFN